MPISLGTAIDAAIHNGLNNLTQSMHAAGDPSRSQRVDEFLAGLKLPANPQSRECLRAALFLLSGDLHQAHEISQSIPTSDGSALHAIVHRLEGDFWNSKYWWRRASGVSFAGLPGAVREALPALPPELATCIASGRYDAPAFVDLVEQHGQRPSLRESLLTIQRLEFAELFGECLNS